MQEQLIHQTLIMFIGVFIFKILLKESSSMYTATNTKMLLEAMGLLHSIPRLSWLWPGLLGPCLMAICL